MDKAVIEFIHELGDGGGSSIVKEYCLHLREDGYRVIVLVTFPTPETTNYKILKEAGIEIVSVFKNKSFLNRFLNKLFSIFFISNKLRLLNSQYKPIVIHSHLCVLRYVYPVRKSLYRTKLLYTCHSLPEKYFSGKNKIEYYAAVHLIRENHLQLIALHEQMADELNEMFKINNTVVLYNGINLQRFRDVSENKSEVKKLLGFKDEDYIIGHVGRFAEPKNHKFILELFRSFSEKNESARLILVGTGHLETAIRDKVLEMGLSEKVKMLTHRTDVERLMKAMDVFLFPSLYEGLGIAFIEAQAASLLCVASDNIPEAAFVSEQVICLSLNEPVNIWMKALQGIGTYSKPCSTLSDYNMDVIIKKLEDIYENKC